MNRFNYGLLAGVMAVMPVFSLESLAAEGCTTVPTCSELGYSQKAEDCMGKHYLKCPFNNDNIYCGEDCSDYTLTACDANKGTVKICEDKCKYITCNSGYEMDAGNCILIHKLTAGDFLFGDGTVAGSLVSGKTPIGVVFDTENKLAVALTDVNSNGAAGSTLMYWSSSYCDTPNLANCMDISTVITSCGVDGRANTTAILASTCNGTTYAANGANSYEPSGCSKDFCKKTKWFLPSMRDLKSLYNARSYVNASLSLTASNGSKTLTESVYWSSTEYNSNYAWVLHMAGGNRSNNNKDYNSRYVRPVIDFSNPDYVAPSCSSDYTLSSCDTSIGTCEECGGKYKYTACKPGWTLSSGNCVVRDCHYYNAFRCGYMQAIRTSGPYTDEECKAIGGNLGNYKAATETCLSGNTVYYGCACPDCTCEE